MTTYASLYPSLAAKYKQIDNFEQIVGAIEKNFPDFFHLELLNEEIRKKGTGSYVVLFEQCMAKLNAFHQTSAAKDKLYQESQVIEVLYKILQEDGIRQQFEQKFLFVPVHKGASSISKPQLGYFEKLATGTLSTPEPFTFLDMRRAINGITLRLVKASKNIPIEVLNLHTLSQLDNKKRSKTLIVNFNVDLRGTPKWGVVDLSLSTGPRVYCETALTEDEKNQLENTLKVKPQYLGATATGVPSTGYTAIAWLDNQITKTWKFDVNSDFPELLSQCLYIQCEGDRPGITYQFHAGELQKYCTESFRKLIYIGSRKQGSEVEPGYIFGKLTLLTALSELQNEKVTNSDLQNIFQIGSQKGWTVPTDIEVYVKTVMHSHPIGFEATLSALRNPKVLEDVSDTHIKLIVPPNMAELVRTIRTTHLETCRLTNTNEEWLDFSTPLNDRIDRAYAAKMVMTLIRCKAKKRLLEIDLPAEYQLTINEQQLMVTSLLNNAYVTDLKINNNKSLQAIKSQLVPTLARNRWLKENGYLPPMADNYWRQAAKYWLIHVCEHPQILEAKKEYELFKTCTLEMGNLGLKAILEVLSDPTERERLERLIGKNKLPFYAACSASELSDYLDTLSSYLKIKNNYFPFSELGMAYQAGNNQAYLSIISKVNKLDKFEKITLTNCLENGPRFKEFLGELVRAARVGRFEGLIVIPELEQKDNVSEAHRVLRSQYALLNNIILDNRQKLAAEKILKGIKSQSNWDKPKNVPKVHNPTKNKDKKDDRAQLLDQHRFIEHIDNKLKKDSWPLHKGGDVQLQLQQQLQLEQIRQVQREQERTILNMITEAMAGTLIDYGNIHEELKDYYKAFALENPINLEAASLGEPHEEILEKFFHTWINANPRVNAYHIISQMTVDAAKALLRHHQRLSSGLNLDNLPKGFFTQRSKDGRLVLCYNPELGYINNPNVLTPVLSVKKPKTESWEGDFRQFDLDAYEMKAPTITKEDIHAILLFAMLQPVKEDYSADYESFRVANPLLLKNCIPLEVQKIKKNWIVFLQAWQYAGDKGIDWFLKQNDADLRLPIPMACKVLFKGIKDAELLEIGFKLVGQNERVLRALGQLFYRYRGDGLTLFLRKLQQMEGALGSDFLAHFSTHILQASENYSCFMSEAFFVAMDDMRDKLGADGSEGTKLVWLKVSEKHMKGVGWEPFETLWAAFDHFSDELNNLGLKLNGDEFDSVPSGNMIVMMDIVLACLRSIPDTEIQKQFLVSLKSRTTDLTRGGMSYALLHEGFKFIDPALKLQDFYNGTPTYALDLKTLYQWSAADINLNIQRTLASKSQFNYKDYQQIVRALIKGNQSPQDLLMWLLHTQYQSLGADDLMQQILSIGDASFRSTIARHLNHAVYQLGNEQLVTTLSGLAALAKHPISTSALDSLLQKYPNGTLLETMSILSQANRLAADQVSSVVALFQQNIAKPQEYSSFLSNTAYKLAVLFGRYEATSLEAFIAATKNIEPVVEAEIRLLAKHLFAIDYSSNLNALAETKNWGALLSTIAAMRNDLAHTAVHRQQFINSLLAQGIKFKVSRGGEYRAIPEDEAQPKDMNSFTEHQAPLWKFLKGHIAVPTQGKVEDALGPITRFLKKLQQNRTYLNEIEPLLASLKKTKANHYWSATYFYQLLMALQPDDNKTAFPITLLKIILDEEQIKPKDLDDVQKEFPKLITASLKMILKSAAFNREQQAVLSQIMLREYQWQDGKLVTLNKIIALLSLDKHKDSRQYALDILGKSSNLRELNTRFENCQWLLEHSCPDQISGMWSQTSGYWLQALSLQKHGVDALYTTVKTFNSNKQAHILHILAFSALRVGLRDAETYAYELERKAPKLAERLHNMSVAELQLLAQSFPQEPVPGVDDLLRIIKQGSANLKQSIDAFSRKPFPESRFDYAKVASTRDADLQRMIAETQVTTEGKKKGLSIKKAVELTLIFNYIKQLEAGVEKIQVGTAKKAISEMTREELKKAFDELSSQEQTTKTVAQISAILFEGMARTTRKYPHLAQQFALIANDIGVTAPTRVLQLATGEGKSHFVAFRAVRHAGLGQIVDISTAKRTLAERDREDYAPLLDYFGITHAYIHPKSLREEYYKAKVHYSTIGDLSLFLDEQSYLGKPVEISPKKRVALFDEFDFMCFEEGRKTEYNYARATGRTPKEMTWFYQEINAFYTQNSARLAGGINGTHVMDLATQLIAAAGVNDDRQAFLASLLEEPIVLVQWLQAAFEAHDLKLGMGFTVREENIKVGDETYPMREIIPLSTDNQKMIGSTFSGGVHQLLAVRMNMLAMKAGEPQNYHLLPESNILSSQVASQRMKELWETWEGFTGTVSTAQAVTLGKEYHTQVLHVPTNQRTLRQWHTPTFYDDVVVVNGSKAPPKDPRMEAVAKQVKICIAKKQSMLFSCKNDLQVTILKESLKVYLTAAEQEHLIFYTNEEHKTSAEVLAEKRQKENWQDGKKQKAIGLVASGFGRGDNVEVETVFLFDVNDTNDKLQKGGRTARNGAAGEVFQFYRTSDIKKELEVLLQSVLPDDIHMITKELKKIKVKGNEGDFEKVMLLREYVFTLQNAANQGYHALLAQYSNWGMKCLGQISNDPLLGRELSNVFTVLMKQIDRAWVDLSGKVDVFGKPLTIAKKIDAIYAVITDSSNQFVKRYAEQAKKEPQAFIQKKENFIGIPLMVEKAQPKPSKVQKTLSSIFSVLSNLPGIDLSPEEMATIPVQLETLSKYEDKLNSFATNAASISSKDDFVKALTLAVLHATPETQSQAWTTEEEYASVKSEYYKLPDVSEKVRLRFQSLMQKLTPELVTGVMDYLNEPTLVNTETQMIQIFPILEFLVKFDPVKEQPKWGRGYIDQLRALTQNLKPELLQTRLNTAVPMHSDHFNLIWKLTQSIGVKDTDVEALLGLIIKALHPLSEIRIRLLTPWESLNKTGISNEIQQKFLNAYCTVLGSVKENVNSEIFNRSLKKTQDWWDKGGFVGPSGIDNHYNSGIINYWHSLSTKKNDLVALAPVLSWGLELGGKAWYQVLSIALQEPTKVLVTYPDLIKKLWVTLDGDKTLKKAVKNQQFSLALKQLNSFDGLSSAPFRTKLQTLVGRRLFTTLAVVASYTGLNQQFSTAMMPLMNLPDENFDALVPVLNEHKDFLLNNPKIIMQLIDCTVEQLKSLAPVLNGYKDFLVNNPTIVMQLINCTVDKLKSLTPLLNEHKVFFVNNPKIVMQLLDCTVDQLMMVSDFANQHKAIVTTDPDVFAQMIHMIKDPAIVVGKKETLVDALVLVAKSHQNNNFDVPLEVLMSEVEAFKDRPMVELNLLVRLLKDHSKYAAHMLADKTISYLAKYVPEHLQDQVLEVIQKFYDHAKVGGELEEKWIRPLFQNALHPEETARAKNHRVMLMHMLQAGAFIVDSDNNGAYRFPADQNDRLQQIGYGHYHENTKRILANRNQLPKPNRDLSIGQQKCLLQLSKELSLIGQPKFTLPKRESLRKLGQDLKTLVGAYQVSWFKSSERINQAAALSKEMDQIESSNGYLMVLQSLHQARKNAFESDANLNKERWIKVNKSGQSRWRNTLNQAMDMVIRQWVQDADNLQDFQRIQGFLNTEFRDLTGQLQQALIDSGLEIESDADGYNGIFRRVGSWFRGKGEINAINELRTELRSLSENMMNDSESMERLLSSLKAKRANLPGHLVTLVDELLLRGDSFVEFAKKRDELAPSEGLSQVN